MDKIKSIVAFCLLCAIILIMVVPRPHHEAVVVNIERTIFEDIVSFEREDGHIYDFYADKGKYKVGQHIKVIMLSDQMRGEVEIKPYNDKVIKILN